MNNPTQEIDPTAYLEYEMQKAGSLVGKKLTTVFHEIYSGDELEFLFDAFTEISEMAAKAPDDTPIKQLIGMWADKKLRVFSH